MTLEEGV
ncbi:rCG30880 [Rattus norvegicus]|nr:rCG30880 [Rattus norvegicus]